MTTLSASGTALYGAAVGSIRIGGAAPAAGGSATALLLLLGGGLVGGAQVSGETVVLQPLLAAQAYRRAGG